jgi:hypothetical protein
LFLEPEDLLFEDGCVAEVWVAVLLLELEELGLSLLLLGWFGGL